jgi:hypothetical protein
VLLAGRSTSCLRAMPTRGFAFDLRLVASKAVKHAVLHGSSREPIELELRLLEDRAELKVRNGGSPVSMKALRAKRATRPGPEDRRRRHRHLVDRERPAGTEISARVSKRDE